MGVVVFDPARFKARYPEFVTVGDVVLADYFTEATLYLDNTDCSRVKNLDQRALLLNMVTAHIAAMNGEGANGDGAHPLVGRIANATEGSVSVATQFATPESGTEAWYYQTKYGAAFWAASAAYRTAFYVAGPANCTGHPVRGRWGY